MQLTPPDDEKDHDYAAPPPEGLSENPETAPVVEPLPEYVEDDEQPVHRGTPWALRLVGLLIVLSFLGLVAGQSLQGLRLPALDFLVRSRQLSRDPAVVALQQAVVQISVVTNQPGAPTQGATGFNVDPAGMIVTNAHVVENARSITIAFPGQSPVEAVEWSTLPGVDLALVRLDSRAANLPVAVLRASGAGPLRAGESVLVIGHPLGLSVVTMQGTVAEVSDSTLVITAPIHPGSSGSPVFDTDGQVAAVIYARLNDSADHISGLAISIAELQKLTK